MINRLNIIKRNINLTKFNFIKSRVQFNQFSTHQILFKNTESKDQNQSQQNPNQSENYWPHPLAIFASLTILYGLWWALDVQYRAGKKYSETKNSIDEKQTILTQHQPKVVLTLGSPHDKKEQALNELINRGFYLIQTSQLFTEELNKPNSPFFDEISQSIQQNTAISVKTTLTLIRDAMVEVIDSKKNFLIDGFPQQMDQVRKFEGSLCDPTLTLYFDCPNDQLAAELAAKSNSQESQSSIEKKLHHYQLTSYPIVQYFMRKDRALVVNSNESLESNITKIVNKFNQLQ